MPWYVYPIILALGIGRFQECCSFVLSRIRVPGGVRVPAAETLTSETLRRPLLGRLPRCTPQEHAVATAGDLGRDDLLDHLLRLAHRHPRDAGHHAAVLRRAVAKVTQELAVRDVLRCRSHAKN